MSGREGGGGVVKRVKRREERGGRDDSLICGSSSSSVEGGWMRGAAAEVAAEFTPKYLERGEEQLRDRWWVEREVGTGRLSVRSDRWSRREEFGGRRRSASLNAKSAEEAVGEDFAFQEHEEKRMSISPTGQEAERLRDSRTLQTASASGSAHIPVLLT